MKIIISAIKINFELNKDETYFVANYYRNQFGEFPDFEEGRNIIAPETDIKTDQIHEKIVSFTNIVRVKSPYGGDAARFRILTTENRVDVFPEFVSFTLDLLCIDLNFYNDIINFACENNLQLVDDASGLLIGTSRAEFLRCIVNNKKFSRYYRNNQIV